MLSRQFLAKAHQTANAGRRCVENIHFILLNDCPEAIRGRVGRYTFKQYTGRGVHQWAINDITMAGHPTYICCTPINVVWLDIKHKSGGSITAHGVAALDMDNSLWLTRTAAGVKDIEDILAVHRLARHNGVSRNIFQQFVQVHVTTLRHRHFFTSALHDDHLLNSGGLANSFVCNFLELDKFAAAIATISSDEHLGLAVVDAVTKGTRSKATKDHHMGRSQAGAG